MLYIYKKKKYGRASTLAITSINIDFLVHITSRNQSTNHICMYNTSLGKLIVVTCWYIEEAQPLKLQPAYVTIHWKCRSIALWKQVNKKLYLEIWIYARKMLFLNQNLGD